MCVQNMDTPVMRLCNLIEDIKTNITDAQYMSMLEELRTIHSEYSWNLPEYIRVPTSERVVNLIHNIVRSGVKNPGQLCYILKNKGHNYEDYLYDTFGEWMRDVGITIENNRLIMQ